MGYLFFGLAIGTFVSGLIEKFYKKEVTNWINPRYLFLVSGFFFVIFTYIEWPVIQKAFENIFS